MPHIGYAAQILAMALAIYAVVISVVGAQKNRQDLIVSGKNAALGVTGLLTIAILVLEYLLLTGHYQTEYVAQVTNNDATPFFRFAALWGGQNGSLLFFAWLMSLFTGTVVLRKWGVVKNLLPYVIAVMQTILVFFIGLVSFVANPFEQLSFFPADGQGLNPLLYHWGMVIHPPILYIGFVGFIVPYAFAMAALITRQRGDLWMRTTRRWSLTAWVFLGAGLLLGGRWAYDVLGWGGYWGWDPVENAALIPWLVATPFLHSVMMQESRGMMKRWNVGLIILTFALVVEGTFLTRSGVIGSVHTFAQSAIGPLFLIFIAIMFFLSLILFIFRWDDLASDNELDSILSRETAFLLNNFLFLGIAVIVWWGTHFPIISEAFTGDKIVVGPPFFKKTTAIPFAIIVLLMGVAPLMPWRHISSGRLMSILKWPAIVGVVTMGLIYAFTWIRLPGAVLGLGFCAFTITTTLIEYGRAIRARQRRHGESVFTALGALIGRNPRRYGGYMIHLGVIFAAIGIIGMEFYQVETQQNIARGEAMTISSPFVGTYELVYQELRLGESRPGVDITEAVLQVRQDGQILGEIVPYREFFVRQQQPMTIPDVYRTFTTELYVIVAGWEAGGETATFKAYINPLINWLWFGGIIFVLGTIIAAWPIPQQTRQKQSVKSSGLPVPVGD